MPKSELIKSALVKNNRVIINLIMIPKIYHGMPINITENLNDGMFDIPSNYFDTDYITDIVNNKLTSHAMIVIGYDDNRKILKLISCIIELVMV